MSDRPDASDYWLAERARAMSHRSVCVTPTEGDFDEMGRRLLEVMDEDEAMDALLVLRPWLCAGDHDR